MSGSARVLQPPGDNIRKQDWSVTSINSPTLLRKEDIIQVLLRLCLHIVC